MREIAQMCQCSPATVSRVLNHPEKVSPITRDKVLATMNEYGYKPQPKLGKPTNLFGFILPDIYNPFFSQLLDVIEKEAHLHGRSILFFNSRHDRYSERLYLAECARHKVDGVFLVPLTSKQSQVDYIKSLPFPVVTLTETLSGLSGIAVDHFEGGKQAAIHLFNQGGKQLGYVGTTINNAKYEGFLSAIASKGDEYNYENTLDITIGDSTRFIEERLRSKKPIDSLFCMNDLTAKKLIDQIVSIDPLILKNTKLIGFDDSTYSKLLKFSSVSQPIITMAHKGFQEMLKIISLTTQTPNHYLYQPKVIDREL
ncbi:LacI family DNA-binding transcriptional regulator [Salinivibrio costicola]|uniref:LacI family DNA-binding transcriptional regulator n=1 Tax=Salinivibrio costicola TaxID=51367 RepID=UPI003F6FB3C9